MATTVDEEARYEELKTLFAKRHALLKVQEFDVLFKMTLKRLHVPEDNVLSFEFSATQSGCLVGIWLKNRDYAGKLRRKAEATAKLNVEHQKAKAEGDRAPWGPDTVRTFGKQWDRSDFVRLDPPLYPPERWLQEVTGRR